MRDVLGNEIDLVRAMRSGAHTGGVLASAEPSLNYMLKHVAPAFEAARLFAPVPPAASDPYPTSKPLNYDISKITSCYRQFE